MTTFGDMVYQLGGVPVGGGFGTIGLAGGDVYFVDVANGHSVGGSQPTNANNSVLTAYGYTTSAKNDVVVLMATGSAWAPAATLTWANSYTHLIGAGAPLPGEGARARIEASGTADILSVLTASGTGNLFSGLKINNMHDAAYDSGAVIITGSRNVFYNTQIFGMGSTAAGARAGSYSLHINNAHENYFERCTIGTDTVLRTAANSEIIIKGVRNSFRDCKIVSNCATAGKFMVNINATVDCRSIIFEDCLFYNYDVDQGDTLTDAFTITGTGKTHDVILKGNCMLVGIDGWANGVATVEGAGAVPHANYGVAITLT